MPSLNSPWPSSLPCNAVPVRSSILYAKPEAPGRATFKLIAAVAGSRAVGAWINSIKMKPHLHRQWGTSAAGQEGDEDEAMSVSSESGDTTDSNVSSLSTSPVKLTQPQQPRMPGLSLNLGGLQRTPDAAPPSARPAIPGLRLPTALPASSSPRQQHPPPLPLPPQSPTASPPITGRQRQPQPPPLPPPATATLTVDLLSPAFSVQPRRDSPLPQQCADRLGVPPDRLRYYALVGAASPAELPPNCERVAVEVAGSTFSLEAMEQLLRENRDLAAAAGDTGCAPPEQRTLREQLAASKQIAKVAQSRVTKLESALLREQAACKELHQEVASLRRQLKKSEELRQRGQRALDDLKHEFEALQRELAWDGMQALGATPSPAAPSSAAAASPMASTPADAGQRSDRLAELLGRLCESSTLDKLEELVRRLET